MSLLTPFESGKLSKVHFKFFTWLPFMRCGAVIVLDCLWLAFCAVLCLRKSYPGKERLCREASVISMALKFETLILVVSDMQGM